MLTEVIWCIFICLTGTNAEKLQPDCESDIFCQGDILKAIQTQYTYADSEKFVEMKLKDSPANIADKFKRIEGSISVRNNLLHIFAKNNFESDEPDKCTKFRSKEMPRLQERVKDEEYRNFVSSITRMWPKLVAQTSNHVRDFPVYHSLVYMPHCFIKNWEFSSTTHYYDNFWIFRGLMSNGMFDTAIGIIRNYVDLIARYDFVLHSNRVYSSRRTQLPLLGLMVETYVDLTKQTEFIKEVLPAMEKEFEWWVENRYMAVVVGGEEYWMFHYDQEGSWGPRPEEYSLDYNLANTLPSQKQKDYFFSAVRALDESGFGFSSRFKSEQFRNAHPESRLNLDVSHIIPVELNSVLERYAFLLMTWKSQYDLDDYEKLGHYEEMSMSLEDAILKVLWNDKKKIWCDWDLANDMHKEDFSPTNLMPLFTLSYDPIFVSQYSEHVIRYLKREKIIKSNGTPRFHIIPTSMKYSGEIWDYPFGSPPLNLFVIEGLYLTEQKKARKVARELAKVLVKTCYVGYKSSRTLFKLYSAVDQGFGLNEKITTKVSEAGYAWTNGALLTLFKWYGKSLKSTDYEGFQLSLKVVSSSASSSYNRRKRKRLKNLN